MTTDERSKLVAIIIRQRAWIDLPGVEFGGKRAHDEFVAIDHALDRLLTVDEQTQLAAACREARKPDAS